MLSRTTRSIFTYSTGVMFNISTILVALTTTPLLVRLLGSQQYGVLRTLVDIFAVLSLFDLGFSRVASITLAEAVASDDRSRIVEALRASTTVLAKVMLFMVAIGLVVIFALPMLSHADNIAAADLRAAGFVMMLPVVLIPLSIGRSLLEAQQKGYLVNVLLVIQSFGSIGLALYFASIGFGVVGQAVALISPQVVFILTTAATLRHYPELLTTKVSAELTARFWKLNWHVFINNIANRLSVFSDNLIVSSMLGAALVTPFYLTQRVPTILQGQLFAVSGAAWVGLLDLYRKGHTESYSARVYELTRMVSSMACIFAAITIAFNKHFIGLWVGASSFGGMDITLLSVANMWLGGVIAIWLWQITGSGAVSVWVPYSLLSAAINLAISFSFTKLFGAAGPLFGTTAAFVLVQSWAVPKLMKQQFQLSPAALWSAALKPMLWATPFGASLYFFSLNWTPASLFNLALTMCAAGTAGLALWFFAGMTVTERSSWYRRFHSALGSTARPVLAWIAR